MWTEQKNIKKNLLLFFYFFFFNQVSFKVAKYSLSADLKYALFAYDVKRVSFTLKCIHNPL